MDKGQAHTKADRKYAEDDQRRFESAFKSLVALTDGRYFLWRLLARCNTLGSPFTANALLTAYASGRQSIGLELLEEFTTLAPDQYVNLLKENLNERSARELAHRTIAARDDGPDFGDSIGYEDE